MEIISNKILLEKLKRYFFEMAFLLPLLGSLISPIISGISGAIQKSHKGKGVYVSPCCGAPMVGGEVMLTAQKHLHHKVRCGECGRKHTVRHGARMTQEIVHHLVSPEGLAMVKHHADMMGEGIWDIAKGALGSLAKAVLPKATEYLGKKAGDFAQKHLGENVGNLVRSGVAKAGDFAQSKVNQHLGSGASFATLQQEGGKANRWTRFEHDNMGKYTGPGGVSHASEAYHKAEDSANEWLSEHSGAYKATKHRVKGSGVEEDVMNAFENVKNAVSRASHGGSVKGARHNPWIAFMKAHPGVPLRELSEMYHSQKESGSGFYL